MVCEFSCIELISISFVAATFHFLEGIHGNSYWSRRIGWIYWTLTMTYASVLYKSPWQSFIVNIDISDLRTIHNAQGEEVPWSAVFSYVADIHLASRFSDGRDKLQLQSFFYFISQLQLQSYPGMYFENVFIIYLFSSIGFLYFFSE